METTREDFCRVRVAIDLIRELTMLYSANHTHTNHIVGCDYQKIVNVD